MMFDECLITYFENSLDPIPEAHWNESNSHYRENTDNNIFIYTS